jgi:DNA-binding response OmpR family regulator
MSMIKTKYKTPNQILVIEDDLTLAFFIKKELERIGYIPHVVSDGKKGLNEALTNVYDLFIIDIGLPNVSGFDIVERIKDIGLKTPIIIITGNDTDENELETFKIGANLFHKKPINFQLLSEQIKSLINQYPKNVSLKIGDLRIEPKKRLIMKNSTEIKLSYKEFEMLLHVIYANGEILSREELLAKTFKGILDLEEGSIDTLVSRVRKKLKKFEADDVIETVHKSGYRLNIKYIKKIKK